MTVLLGFIYPDQGGATTFLRLLRIDLRPREGFELAQGKRCCAGDQKRFPLMRVHFGPLLSITA